MVATDLQNPEFEKSHATNTLSSTSKETHSVSMSKETPETEVMRLRVSIGGTFSQVSNLKMLAASFSHLAHRQYTLVLPCSMFIDVLT